MKFFDEQSGAVLIMDRFYGFGDAGGLAGSFDGYETSESCLEAVRRDHTNDVSTVPSNLGRVAVCVLSGSQYVTELRKVRNLPLSIFGHFVNDDGTSMSPEELKAAGFDYE